MLLLERPPTKPCHIYLFFDGCPTDWLVDGCDEQWHTIAYFVFQSDPKLKQHGSEPEDFQLLLDQDPYFHRMLSPFKKADGSGFKLKKWKTGPAYRKWFLDALSKLDKGFYPQFNAVSFQEKELRVYKNQLLEQVNKLFFGAQIGFVDSIDGKGRRIMTHSYVEPNTGFHTISMPENKLLVLLLMAFLIGDQFTFYRRKVLKNTNLGFNEMYVTVVSDKLSGDDDIKRYCEHCLQYLISNAKEHIALTRSRVSDKNPGDLLVDNLAGLLNNCISNPTGEFNSELMSFPFLGFFEGWNRLTQVNGTFEFVPVIAKDLLGAA